MYHHMRDLLLLYGIKNVDTILHNPSKPMTRSLRVIGGAFNGRTVPVSTTSGSIYLGLQRYDIRTLSYKTANASVSETVLVYSQTNERAALEALVKLPMPALPVVPTFKAFSIDDSSAIDEIRYDRKLRLLEVDLAGSGTYRYENVPANVAGELLLAESKGQFFNGFIKGQYPSTKI
jgi:hypothetical protein